VTGSVECLDVSFEYEPGQPVLKHVRRISTPGLRRYIKSKDIRPVRGGLGVAVLTTPDGVITDREARKKNVGGELLMELW